MIEYSDETKLYSIDCNDSVVYMPDKETAEMLQAVIDRNSNKSDKVVSLKERRIMRMLSNNPFNGGSCA